MTDNPNNRVRVVFKCQRAHDHELCVTVNGGVPPELRCDVNQGQGYGPGQGGGCTVPADLDVRVGRALRDGLQEAKRRGYVLVAR